METKSELPLYKRLDLKVFGAIGFEPYWLKAQGYKGKNLAQLLVDACIEKEIDVCGIASEQFGIQRGSVHDRFGYILRQAQYLPGDYNVSNSMDDIVFTVGKEGKRVIIVNTQAVVVLDKEDGENRRYNFFVVGSNQVPNQKTFAETFEYCQKHGLISMLEHLFLERDYIIPSNAHERRVRAIGEEITKSYFRDCDAIITHDSQLTLPELFSFLPAIGCCNRGANIKAQKFAVEHKMPKVAVSGAKEFRDIGTAYTFLNFEPDLSDGRAFLQSLKHAIAEDETKGLYQGYLPLLMFMRQSAQFAHGMHVMRHHPEYFV